MTKRDSDDVLRYTDDGEHAETLLRHYLSQRKEPERCDISLCEFFTEPLEWCGQPLNLVLDHINGVNSDNRVENLRFLCPNCNSQQSTFAGRNKGKVGKSSGGFYTKEGDLRHYVVPAQPGRVSITGGDATMPIGRVGGDDEPA